MKNIEVICMGGCKVLIQNIFHYYSYPQRVGMNSVKCVRIYNCSVGQMEQNYERRPTDAISQDWDIF